MLLALDNILRDFFNLKFYLSETFDSWKNDQKSPGKEFSDSSLKSQTEQKNVEFFYRIYNFLSSNFNSLGKIRKGKENSEAKLLKFQKNG